VADLVGKLHSPSAGARAAAARRLGEMGAKAASAVPALVGLLADKTEVDAEGSLLGEVVGQALGRIGGPGVTALLNALSDKDAYVRYVAIQGLAYTRDKRATAPLRTALHDRDQKIRAHAALALGCRNDTTAIGDLLRLLKSDASSMVRTDAAMALGVMKAGPAVEGLIGALKDRDPSVRECAALALASIHDPRAVPPLIPLLQDKDAQVRLAGTRSLGDFTADPRVLEPLISALRDQKTRGMAAEWLAKSQNPLLVPRMIELLKDRDASVREQAAWVLGAKGDRAAIGPLTAALRDKDVRVRAAAAAALDKIR
jgi:HEAT repeat protein